MYLHFIHHLYISRMLKGLYLPNRRCNKHDFVLIYADFTPPFGITIEYSRPWKNKYSTFRFFFSYFFANDTKSAGWKMEMTNE